jgi:hypothetical protein
MYRDTNTGRWVIIAFVDLCGPVPDMFAGFREASFDASEEPYLNTGDQIKCWDEGGIYEFTTLSLQCNKRNESSAGGGGGAGGSGGGDGSGSGGGDSTSKGMCSFAFGPYITGVVMAIAVVLL